ncbi:MAG: hypothetical protein L6V35_10125 [Alistipes putredinis]|nr:MAG: hypothetical protein L6V35_10125 [Alistipes putredinis]
MYPQIEALSNDELRARSAALRLSIAEFIKPEEDKNRGTQSTSGTARRGSGRKRRDFPRDRQSATQRIDDKIEEKLDSILPEAFAIMKDTARRFAQKRYGGGHRDRFRPQSCRQEGFRYHSGRQGDLFDHLDCGRKPRQVGHDSLRLPAFRRRGFA